MRDCQSPGVPTSRDSCSNGTAMADSSCASNRVGSGAPSSARRSKTGVRCCAARPLAPSPRRSRCGSRSGVLAPTATRPGCPSSQRVTMPAEPPTSSIASRSRSSSRRAGRSRRRSGAPDAAAPRAGGGRRSRARRRSGGLRCRTGRMAWPGSRRRRPACLRCGVRHRPARSAG